MLYATPYLVLENLVLRTGVLARDLDGHWFTLDKKRPLSGLTRVMNDWQGALTSLTRDGLLEPNRVAAFYTYRPHTQLTVHDLTADAVYILAETLKMPRAFISKEVKEGRGTYTTRQADSLHRIQRDQADNLGMDLILALSNLRRVSGSKLVRSRRPAGPTRPRVRWGGRGQGHLTLTAEVGASLVRLRLIKPDPNADSNTDHGHAGAHVLTADGRSLVRDYSRGVFDPADARLSTKNLHNRVHLREQGIDYFAYDAEATDPEHLRRD